MGLITWLFGDGDPPPRKENPHGEFWKKDPWNLDRPILPLSERDFLTLRHACESVIIFGEIGAAKSTGVGRCAITGIFGSCEWECCSTA